MFGNGPGTASVLISASFRNISHPHNEYLRLFHDFGHVGAVLFVLGLLSLLWRTASRARHSSDPIHWSALLGILAVIAAAFTDNVIIYTFVMIPLGLLVGASLGLPVGAESPKEVRPRQPYISLAYKRLMDSRASGR